MKIKYFLLLTLFFINYAIQAQLSKNQYQQIDSLFQEWNSPNHPGGAIGIMKDGKTVFSKAYGLASLEYLVPNNNGTIFNLASVSKQFTAMGIVLLDLQGKLSVNDDIRKHLPELPDFGHTITISHMLHHTSGLRSLHALLGLAGWRGDDSRSNADIDRFMLSQKELNFVPGDEYLYCNTGFMLCVNIIEKISGQPFTEWMEENVFQPLDMQHTYAEDNYSRIVPDNATSYYGNQEHGFERAVEYWAYVGSGNMHSTTADLLKWLDQFSNPKEGWSDAFHKLQTMDNFNSGKPNSYAFGVSIGALNGYKKIGHGGAIGGFRSSVAAYPEEKLSIAVLTNFSSANAGGMENKIARILLAKPEMAEVQEKTPMNFKTIALTNVELEEYEGWYWCDRDNFARKIYLKADTLRYSRSKTSESLLIPVAKNKFRMLADGLEVYVDFEKSGQNAAMSVIEGDLITQFESFEKREPTRQELRAYEGSYYSPEIETTYKIQLDNAKLTGYHVRHGDFPIKVLKKDVMDGGYPLGIIKVQRDSSGNILGIRVSNGRVRNLWFRKN
jgi:CubicO group peptidase (beta-lactamase class C family)